jgi:hypothetical protein
MSHTEAKAVVRPGDRRRDRVERIGSRLLQTRELPRHAVILVIRERVSKIGQGLRLPLGRRRIGHVDPDDSIDDLGRVGAEPVALQQVVARPQVELPAVPVAGQYAIVGERALAQRISLMRTAVVAGVDRIARGEQRDLLAGEFRHDLSVAPNPLQ